MKVVLKVEVLSLFVSVAFNILFYFTYSITVGFKYKPQLNVHVSLPGQKEVKKLQNKNIPIVIISILENTVSKKCELTAFGQIISDIPDVVWIVAEMRPQTNPRMVPRFLRKRSLETIYLSVQFHDSTNNTRHLEAQLLNCALKELVGLPHSSVVMFANPGFVYDKQVFKQIRSIEMVGFLVLQFDGKSSQNDLIQIKEKKVHGEFCTIPGATVQNLVIKSKIMTESNFSFGQDQSTTLYNQVCNNLMLGKRKPKFVGLVKSIAWSIRTSNPNLALEKDYANERGHYSDVNFEV